MQTITILTAGPHHADIAPLISQYERRLQPDYRLSWRIVKGQDTMSERRAIEAALPSRYILLDESGDTIESSVIAHTLEQHAVGVIPLCFVIGGAYGVNDATKQGASATWAFGRITLPHQLTRLLLTEQLFRARAILKNHPYHHA